MTRLSVVGLGKLGACTAACLAHKGFPTLGMDVNPEFVKVINAGRAPVYEPGLDELLEASRGKIRATQDYREVLEESDVTFLIVPTPSQDDGHFSDRHLRDAVDGLARALRASDKSYHLFVITSTVSPGTTERSLIPLMETVSGRTLRQDFGVCYNPEFIALGSVIRDFLHPDLVLIGESDRRAGDVLEGIYRAVCENTPHVARMSIVSAEITKLSLNSYVTMKISFANTLASICEDIPGADIDAITAALGVDRRVSPYALHGGLPYGGPCFPRDNRAFVAFARQRGVDATLARATDEVNRLQIRRLVDLVTSHLEGLPARTASVLGLAYKPNTPVIEESAAIALVDELLSRGITVTVYDSLAADAARARYGERVRHASTVQDAMARSSITVITMPSPEFASIDDSYVVHNPAVIVDCWRILDPGKFRKTVTYLAVGAHHA